jgi:hypothetical protein
MTAEELIENKHPIMTEQNDWWWYESKIIEVMKEYARIKCAEQRKICAEYAEMDVDDTDYMNLKMVIVKDSILNAPEPKYD